MTNRKNVEKKIRKKADKGDAKATSSSSSAFLTPEGWLEIGTIVAPQGLDGQMRVYPDTDFPERFEVPGIRWLLRPDQTEPKTVELLSGRYIPGKNLYVIELEGVEDRNQAEELRGCKLMVQQSDRPQLQEGEYHVMDLIGLPVFIQESGELLGAVVDILPAGHDLLEVQLHQEKQGEKSQKNLLIPFVKPIVPVVDLEAGRIEITPPDGLLEIN
ncbi:MAG: ribosome maturation factor RimM [Brasilonema octagenarum HA4186-MV1]|jgi:16S rRNA processing protein RimM|uniref:Ribosome maturation factor RimM n=2 Tax=Brasilonema TaxID=383614 RepID=A0A856MFC6_9CYAN|nr:MULTISPECIES: ribosome maturation factor RimM [Brasilonema]MBW4629360.1 ribosome maturation factor RimM [Brasilonema octagenarum HA4186-MV1]NMF66974.1 ribosome maturation factor RimM [Brasilonema octagenarum UFV-OR1]QDL09903.1 ribosome maturation factor RimM [Brasilonema sennae CENA114]QDL16255.1 ribosome maturation factor RimM [Brasilonema octagenarum UFV-E1]